MRLPSAPVSIVAAAALLAAGLVGLVVREGVMRAEGQEVLLEIAGYDPRSLLSGHYVQFRLQSELAPGAPCPPGSEAAAPKLRWVALRRAGAHHLPSGAADTRAGARRMGEVAVRGRLICAGSVRPGTGVDIVIAPPRGEPPTRVWLDLGIDRAHFDQTQAEAIQLVLQRTADRPARAYAVVSVGRDGRARLKGLVVGGQRSNLDWF